MEGIEMGDMVKDRLTGITGRVIARAQYLYGVPTACVEYVSEGKIVEVWFAEGRLAKVENA